MKTIGKQILSLLLIMALVLQILPASVFATGENEDTRTLEELLLTDEGSLVSTSNSSAEILFEEVSLREENVKHFRMTDGSYKAVVYDTPVHYLDENDVWQEYNNTLQTVSRNGETTAYCVENGDSLRLFAADSASGVLLAVQKGNYSLSLTPSSLIFPDHPEMMNISEEIEAEILTIAAPADEPMADNFNAQIQPDNIYSALEYSNVLEGATLRYENYANSIKESIVIAAPQEEYAYTFLMQVVGLTPTLQTDGSIFLADEDGAVIYTIPAPYMIDANNEVSYAASYTMAEKSGTWILTVTADSAWMNAEGRAFPVLLDPTITETAASDDDICATFVRSGAPDAVTGTETGLYAGNNGNSNQKTRTYVHINELPVLPAGCELTGAAFELYQYAYEGSGSLDIGLYALTSATYNGSKINGLTATTTWKNWANGLTWNMANSTSAVHGSTIVDRLTTSSANSGDYVAWDITKLAFQWYDSDNDGAGSCLANYGFMLKPTDEDSATSRVTFYGPKKTTNRPRIVISYHNVRGIEGDYTYQTASIGRAGTAYIGDFAMQNTIVVPLASAPSDVMPFSVSLVYNSSMRGRYFSSSYESINSKNFDTMKTGIGWKLSLQETVVPLTIGDTTYLVYTDSDGTEHYYIYSGEENAYVEENSNARLKITQSGSEYILADEYGGTKTFFNGYLTKIKDAYNNALYYCYDGVDYSAESTAWKPTASGAHKITSVWRENNGVSAEKILVLGYNGEFLSTIIPKCDYSSEDSKADHRIYLTYETRTTGSYLSQIQFADGAKAQYQYIAENAKYWRKNKLSSAYDAESNYGVSFDYSYSGKSEDIYEYVLLNPAASNTESNREYGVKIHGYKRAHTLAVWRDYGRDQAEGTSDDYLTYKVLNRIGQTVSSYTTDNNEKHILGSSAAEYTSSTNRKQNNLLSASAYTAQPGVNLLRNSDAEDNASYWSAVNISSSVRYNGGKSFILNNNSFYQLATLSAGKTYTFSAYVNMETAADESVVQLALMSASGEILSASPALTTSTQGVNDGWQRLSATYHNSGSSDITVMAAMLSSGLSGNAYVDCLQLEEESAASTYNLIENGSFEQDATISTSVPAVGWYYAGNASVTTEGAPHFGQKSLKIAGGSGIQRISQQILLNAPAGSTFLLSGWGKADALPGSVEKKSENDQPYFGLIARLYYADGSSDVFYFSFDQYSNNWQQVSGVIAPKEGNEGKAITNVSVVAAYDNNINTAYFDNISFRREPAQTYRYDEKGNPIAATQTGTGTEGAEYAENGVDLLNYTAANGTKYNYEYNNAHDVTSASAAGITAETDYNDAGNVTGSTLSGTGTTLTMVSAATATDDLNHTATATDTSGNTTTYTYDDYSGLLTEVKNAKNSVTHYSYAVGNLRTESVQQDELVRINYGYENGNLTSLTRGDYDEDAEGYIDAATAQTYNFSYNRWGQVTETRVGSQTLSANTYYAFNGEDEGVGGYLRSTAYGNGDEITYTYDELDRLVEKAYTNGTYIRYIYNSEGQLAELIHGETGAETLTAHFFFEYDSLGRLIRSAEYDGDSTLVQRTEHIYDAYNRLSSQSWGFGTTTYDESYTYSDGENGDGSITQMTTATGDAIGYTYDELKRLESTATTNANGALLFTTNYAYRNLSTTRTTSQIEFRNVRKPDGTLIDGYKYEYDELGNIIGIYESEERVEDQPRRQLAAYEYDAQNQLLSETIYNYADREDNSVTPSTTPSETIVYSYTYDTAGNILTESKNGTVTKIYTYATGDWKDLLQSFTRNGATYSITYDGSGNPLSYGNWSFAWQNGRQLSSATSSTDTTDTTLSYTYDADGIRTSKTYTVDTYEDIPQYTVTFVADGTTVKTMTVLDGYVLQFGDYPTVPPKNGYWGTWIKHTSAIHNDITVNATYRPSTVTYTVTFVANLKTVKIMTVNAGYVLQDSDYPAVPPRTGLTGSWNKYTSPINSNITITAVYRKGSASVASLEETESSSNIVFDGSDAEILSSEVATAEVETASLPEREGQRLVSTQTVSHEYLTISGRVAREIIKTDGTVTTVMDFIYDAEGRPFALNYFEGTETEADTYYYVLNLQGDVVKLVTANGTSVAEYTYNAWGEILTSNGAMADINPLRYRGYYYDTETGWYYLQSRYYDPANHRFINADSYASTDASDAISCNMFAYCGNNPVIAADQNGEWLNIVIGAIVGAVVGAITEVVEQKSEGRPVDGLEILVGAVAGAGAGVLSSVGLGALGGALSSFTTSAYDNCREYSAGERTLGQAITLTAINTGIGALFGAMGSGSKAALLKSNTISNAGVNGLKTLAQRATGTAVHPQVLKVANGAVQTMGRYIVKSGLSELAGSAISTAAQVGSENLFEKVSDYYWELAA